MIELTTSMLEGLPKTGETDPIEYYRRPLVGVLFRKRINLGLAMLPERRFASALEVGYGAGAVLLALAPATGRLCGLDLDTDPGPATRLLASRGHSAELTRGSVYEMPYETASFELAASFSMFEHLDEYERGLREVARVVRPGGLFLLGMPAVNKMMEALFLAIGFRGIDHHHVTTPENVRAKLSATGFSIVSEAHLDVPLPRPFGVTLYYDWLLRRDE